MKTGIWIDTHKALIVELDNDESKLRTIASDVVTREREDGEGKDYGRFGDQYLEHNDQGRVKGQIAQFIKRVISEIEKADELVVFGPAGMKDELKKGIELTPGLAARLRGVETTDAMTENQVVAWVRDYFR